MPNAKTKNYLHLHLLVFIAGFTAILGELISIGSTALVWYRMCIAGVLMFLYIKMIRLKIKVSTKTKFKFFGAGIIIALHWITFFEAINQSNVSIALAMFSTGAFFASFIEPLFYRRRVIWYEIVFGLVVITGVFLITQSEIAYINGIVLGIVSALLSTLFSVINGRLIEQHSATVISFYEFISGLVFLSVFILVFQGGFSAQFFTLSAADAWYLFILASVCTAYAFIGAVDVMRYVSPYTVILTYNLEPVYGIVLAIFIFPETEIMSSQFYYGAFLVLSMVIADGILKNYKSHKKRIALASKPD
ncbi:EamA family transporter [Subsaximicrobium wynnwilliamsii]|uniref:EamA family transporter n=1 Tax=Subsaximicrobium wynnwilliamsii TaxID=291179 RepID=A0A5C6ZC48_9FLAO|nr:DMT family transporter [Subsaximicrobium wynnwilliamsii]TXD81259.1 EamA family transporter [Subsaximicrobium wynnwilliamsii]TXD86960.1 EamA family transporter [Subsaximicrobium wynnwilliamsii]TXE00580.1 EamA family transporter [Subsaximicrobium wynnwilliamsii]